MRKLIVNILAAALSFAVASYLIQGFQIDPTWQTYLIGSIVYLLTSGIIGPVIKLLLLPLNLITLGLFQWATSVIVLYIFDMLYKGVTVAAYDFPGFSSNVIALPPGNVSLFWTLVLSSLVMAISYSIITSLFSSQ